ncbi:MAG: NfeD family protein [Alphaproteobacteria bacterium]
MTIADWLGTISFWAWWAFAIALVAIEVFVPSSLLLGPAFAALVVGLVLLLAPDFAWQFQLLAFAGLSIPATFVARRIWRPRSTPGEAPLNRRGDRLRGRHVTLDAAMTDGHGRLHVDGESWLAESADGVTLAAGTTVEVVGLDGATLKVRPVSH